MKKKKKYIKKDVVETMEKFRKKAVYKLFLMLFVFFIYLMIVLNNSYDLFYSRMGEKLNLFILVVILVVHALDSIKFHKMYKDNIVRPCIENSFDDVEFNCDKGISKETIEATKMMRTGDVFESDDYIKAKYKNVTFECSDVTIKVKNRFRSENESYYTTLFAGQWYIFDFNKSFKSDIEVCEKSFSGNSTGSIFDKDKLKKVELEDVSFHNKFDVYAKNELDAFYVLTPPMIEKIKKLNADIPGEFLLCFCGNKLHIGLCNYENNYQHNIFTKIDLEEERKTILKDLSVIIKFVDTLKLDEDLFKKK